MAWNKGSKVESTEITIIKENNNNQNPIFSLISKFQSFFNLPPPPAKPQAEEEPNTGKVKVPRGQVEIPSLKLEGDDQCRDQTTNPIVLWQVYAIGGFLVVRWMLARFKEKRTRKPPADEGSPPADD